MNATTNTMSPTSPKPFGKLRNFLWPIHGFEHKKLLPMLALFFLISFVYNLLRCMKVTVVVTGQTSGAEVIPFLKVWAVLPVAVLITYLYTRLSNRLNREQVFYIMLVLFLAFFTFFLLILHPNHKALELDTLANFLQNQLPNGSRGFISMIRHWPLSLFYVISEMWSAVVLSMLFWGFANEVTSIDEAKRFYAIFALSANFSGIFSGQSAQFLSVTEYNPNIPFGTEAWEQTLGLQLGAVLILGMVIMVLFRWVNRTIVQYDDNKKKQMDAIRNESNRIQSNRSESTIAMTTLPENEKQAQSNDSVEEEKKKLSLKECFVYLAKSRYMLYITILVVAYNIVYNLADVLWTDQLSQRYPNASDFNAYINQIASITGIFATLSGLILSGNVIRRYGWTATAMITPIIWLITSVGFFGGLMIQNSIPLSDMVYALFQVPAVSLALFFGSAQICLGRASKYTVFDETKEIAFIPLPKSEQRKGKAVVDGIASRFGKSGGSLIIQFLLFLCGELAMTIPYIAGIFVIVLTCWFTAVRGLGKMVSKSIDSVGNESLANQVPEKTIVGPATNINQGKSLTTELPSKA